jgi:hypothetical protein
MASTDMWTCREAGALGVDMGLGIDIVGHSVEALLGKNVLLPAGVVDRVDSAVDETRDDFTTARPRLFSWAPDRRPARSVPAGVRAG